MAQSLDRDDYTDATNAADALMDELFGDIEKNLHIDKSAIVACPHQPTVELEDLEPEEDVMWLSPYSPPPEPPQSPPPPESNQDQDRDKNWLTSLLLVCACGSALFATILWSFHLSAKLAQLNNAATTAVAPANSHFRDEIRELLAYSPPAPLPTPTATELPPPVTTPPLPQTIYVPVYQAPIAALPPVEPTPAPAETPASVPTPAPAYTLVGVLSFGDRATAMFELNGTVETIGVGKPVGDTGWILSKVQQRDVVLKRNNETKTVLVGQKL
ncbi:MAG: hypothetical protein ACK4QL_05345 [Pseudanabaenaceae cyanobacterium]